MKTVSASLHPETGSRGLRATPGFSVARHEARPLLISTCHRNWLKHANAANRKIKRLPAPAPTPVASPLASAASSQRGRSAFPLGREHPASRSRPAAVHRKCRPRGRGWAAGAVVPRGAARR